MAAVSFSLSHAGTPCLCKSSDKRPFLYLHNASFSQAQARTKPSTVARSSVSGACNFNPLSTSVKEMNRRRRRGSSVVCYAAPLAARNLEWISAISSAILVLSKGTAISKSFLVPLFVLQAPASIISWFKGEYGLWAAFLALVVRLFFHIPGELELPFMALLLAIAAPYQVMNIRGTQQGAIFSLLIAGYLAYQHFSRAGSLQRAFDQGSVIATIAVICITLVPILLLI